MEKKEDVRIIKSKRDLCNALVKLVGNKPFKKITVGDICAEAMVNRMTFYKHYGDKYELLNDVFLGVKKQIMARAAAAARKPADDMGLEVLFLLINAVLDECIRYKDFLTAVSNDDMALTMISTTVEKSIRELLEGYAEVLHFKYRLDVLVAAVTGAVTFMIRYWLFHEPESSKDYFFEKSTEFLRGLFNSKLLFE